MSLHSTWRQAKVVSAKRAADDMMSIVLKPEDWIPHQAGQHYELRLPGHHLSRKYSVVSSPQQIGALEFGVQLLPYGEVSPKLWQLGADDQLQIRGPLGGFMWTPEMREPLVLIGAGSGITPLLAIYDHRKQLLPGSRTLLIVSAKNPGRVMHYSERGRDMITRFTATEGRIDKAFLANTIGCLVRNQGARCLVCGPGGFTGDVIDMLIGLDFGEGQIRREMFG